MTPAPRARLAELVGVLAMATDLGLGLPLEHTVRTCLLAMALGRRAGMSQAELSDLYYLTLLRMMGCTAESDYAAEIFGDEVAFGRETQHLDYGDAEGFGAWVMTSFAADRAPAVRNRMLEKLLTYTPERRADTLRGHCEVARMLATRLRLSDRVVTGVGYVFERWDGSGAPSGVGGEALPLGVRVMTICNEIEIHARLGGPDGAADMVRQRSGAAFDPGLAALFLAERDSLLAVIDRPALWADVLAAEPAPHRSLDPAALGEAARVIGDFTDLKSSYLTGHSRAVAALAGAAGDRARLDDDDRAVLGIAALMQDVGPGPRAHRPRGRRPTPGRPRGSIQDAAGDLHLAAKTVDFHLQSIYAKAGVSTRAAATLFAVQNDLLEL